MAVDALSRYGMTRRLSLLWAATLAAIAGCGLGGGKVPSQVELTLTRDFGARVLRDVHAGRVSGMETILSLLQGRFTVRVSGGAVQSIDGASADRSVGKSSDWGYYVNGVEASKPTGTKVHPGDRIWWDLHDGRQAADVRAIVGSFPEPFLAGIDGERLPVRVECVQPSGSACKTTLSRLRTLGVPAALSAPSGVDSPDTLRVLVGPFSAIAADPGAYNLRRGPRYSGVYGCFSADGETLALLDASGRAVRRLGAGAGLLAATRYAKEAPVWVITGTDVAGVGRAANALDEAALRNHFALSIPVAGQAVALPYGG
jgi:Domain of unknown function (DUF4430)